VPGEKSLAALYDEFYPQIRRYIASRTNSSADADDLAQDVFLEFYKSNRHKDAEAYLFGIARKTVLANHRKRKKSPKIIPVDSIDGIWGTQAAEQSRDPTSEMLQEDLKKMLEAAMEKLPPKALEAVKLRLVQGLAPEAAAKAAGCPIDTFYRRLYEGLKVLRSRCFRA
jgi:RNA polymerase sigma factor (sigma-70 family)